MKTIVMKLGLVSGGTFIALYLAMCLFLYLWQTRMIFFPSAVIETTPDVFNVTYEEVWHPVGSADRPAQIHGWWIPAAGEEKGVLLYLHGNGINIGANMAHAHRFHQLGFSVLLMDYRGYGRSEGAFPSEASVYQDAEAMWHYLTQIRGIAPSRIWVYGHSLGGAIAIELATRHPNLAGLIVDGSFTSIRHLVALRPGFHVFPVDWLLTQRFDSIRKVTRLTMPVLFIHGLDDTTVPAHMSQQLYQAAAEPKQLYLVPHAGHNNVAEVAGAGYLDTVRQFTQLKQRQAKNQADYPTESNVPKL